MVVIVRLGDCQCVTGWLSVNDWAVNSVSLGGMSVSERPMVVSVLLGGCQWLTW